MRKRWLVILSGASVALVIAGCLLAVLVGISTLNRALHPTYPATKVCQPGSGASTAAAQPGQPVVLAVVHAYLYQHLVGGYRGIYSPIGPQTNYICELRPSDGSLVRRFDIGYGSTVFTSIVQSGATWYLSAYATDALDNPIGTLYALNGQTGTTRWRFTIPQNGGTGVFAYAISAAGNIVYVRATNAVYSLDATSGQQRWGTPLATPFYADMSLLETVGGMVTLATPESHPTSSSPSEVVALAPATGAILWRSSLDITEPSFEQIASDGTTVSVEALSIQGEHAPGQIIALRASDGVIAWQMQLPCVSGLIPLADEEGLTYFDACGGNSPQILHTFVAVHASTGAPAWRFNLTDNPIEVGSSTMSGDVLYLSSFFGASISAKTATSEIYALRLADGKVLWKSSQSLTRIDTGSQSLLVVNGVVCRTQYESHVMAIDGYRAADGAALWRVSYTGHEQFADASEAPSITHDLWPAQFASLTVVGSGAT